MERTIKVFKFLKCSPTFQPWDVIKWSKAVVTARSYCKEPEIEKEVRRRSENQRVNSSEFSENRPSLLEIKQALYIPPWNEKRAIRKTKKKNSFLRNVDNVIDVVRKFQKINELPGTPKEIYYYLKRRKVKNEVLAQMYLPERHSKLRPDLAAAHFLIERGGSVKFVGNSDWTGKNEVRNFLPSTYVPGYFIEAINAEGTGLYYEGLQNLCQLRHLKSLSLKGLEHINDWCLDWISKEYYVELEHLDISQCKKVTHRGLSCFYRFENLKTLNVEGISDSSEFKLACIMLEEIMPELEIKGIDMSVPPKIDPVETEEVKVLSNEEKQVSVQK